MSRLLLWKQSPDVARRATVATTDAHAMVTSMKATASATPGKDYSLWLGQGVFI